MPEKGSLPPPLSPGPWPRPWDQTFLLSRGILVFKGERAVTPTPAGASSHSRFTFQRRKEAFPHPPRFLLLTPTTCPFLTSPGNGSRLLSLPPSRPIRLGLPCCQHFAPMQAPQDIKQPFRPGSLGEVGSGDTHLGTGWGDGSHKAATPGFSLHRDLRLPTDRSGCR